MKNIVTIILAIVAIASLTFGIYTNNKSIKLEREYQQLDEKYHYLKGSMEVLRYDLDDSRDSVRVLLKNVEKYGEIEFYETKITDEK